MSSQNESQQFTVYPELNSIPIINWSNFSSLSNGDVVNGVNRFTDFLDSISDQKRFTPEQFKEINTAVRYACNNLLGLHKINKKGPSCLSYSYLNLAADLRKKFCLVNGTCRIG